MKLTKKIKEKLGLQGWVPGDPYTEYFVGHRFKDIGRIYPTLFVEYKTYDHPENPRIISILKKIEDEWTIVDEIYLKASKYNQPEKEKLLYKKRKLRMIS